MIRSQRFWIFVAAAVFSVSVIWAAVIVFRRNERNCVNIYSDGKLLYTIDLSKEADREISVEFEGRKNIIEIKNSRIRVSSADCPDCLCVSQGWQEAGKLYPIICLPNKLVIEPADAELDGIAR